MVVNWAVSQIDLSDAGFWGLPPGARDAAFGVLRRERPVAFFPESALPLLPLAGYAQELSRGKRTRPGDAWSACWQPGNSMAGR